MYYFLIARVSDKNQRKALPAQKKRLIDYANSKNLVEGKDYKYLEFDETAFKGDIRREFERLVIQPVKEARDMLILAFDKTDRFSRDTSDEHKSYLVKQTKLGKIELHFVHDNLFVDKNSPATDWFRLDINVALASYYSASIRDNVLRRFEQMLDDGIWVGSAPLGYKNVNLGTPEKPIKDIHVDRTRAHYIVKMFEMRAAGLPYEVIAKRINAAGLRSKKGVKLNKSAVEKILNNPFYYGKMRYLGKEYPHKYETLISYKLFMQCQAIRKQRHDTHTAYNSLAFAFKDNVKCSKCGCTVSCFNARNNVYLKCSGAKGRCGNQNTAMKIVMPEVAERLGDIPIPPKAVEKVIDELKKRHNNQQDYYSNSIDTARSEYDKIKSRLKALTYERLDGRITTDIFDEIVNELTARQQELDEQLMTLTHSNKSFIVTISYLLDLAQRSADLFKNARPELQQKMLKIVLSNMELNDKKLSYIVNDPYKTMIQENKKAQNEPGSEQWCG